MLSTADWDRPLWTNKQFLARELSRRMRVTYLDSIGLRRPTLTAGDAARVVGRLRRAAARSPVKRGVDAGLLLDVRSPFTVPYHSARLARHVNRRSLERIASDWLAAPRDTRVLWTFSPVTYGLEDAASATVYHCVDRLGEFPRVDHTLIAEGERRLAEKGVVAVASSTGVEAHLHEVGMQEVLLWENVADVPVFEEQANGPRENGLVVFAGNLIEHKVDFELLERVASAVPRLVLAGTPAEDGRGRGALRALQRHHDVEHVGTLALRDLAALLGRACVGLVPYVQNDYTAGVFPMKIYEYLGAGLPVVATPLPSLMKIADEDIILAANDDFVARVSGFASETPSGVEVERRVAKARSHSWEARGHDAADLVGELLAGEREAAWSR